MSYQRGLTSFDVPPILLHLGQSEHHDDNNVSTHLCKSELSFLLLSTAGLLPCPLNNSCLFCELFQPCMIDDYITDVKVKSLPSKSSVEL